MLPLEATSNRRKAWLRRFRRWQEINRLRSFPPSQPTCTGLLGRPLQLVDARTFLATYHETFVGQIYRFNTQRERPLILDCGASIGVYTLYWKLLYPTARVVAFEPDPGIFQALAWNCS